MEQGINIIINAVTKDAKKKINDVTKELNKLSGSGKGTSKVMAGVAKGVGIAVGAIAAAVTAVYALGKATVDTNKNLAKLNTAFAASGMSARQASETYLNLYRFLGDSDKATEAAAHLAKITNSQQELAEWSKIAQGVYSSFGDSLAIEGFTEAANETLRVGKVTGTLADALNWAGVSEDEFNAKLAATTSFEEREALLRSTLNGLYSDAANIYEKNNKALLDYNTSQANLSMVTAAAGQACLPLLTAVNNLGTALMQALKPALDVIVPALATFVNWITQGLQAVMSFFSALTGKSASVKTLGSAGANAGASMAGGFKEAAKAADGAAKAVEEAKRSTQGFDELNIVSSGSSSGSGGGASGGGGGASAPSYFAPTFDNTQFDTSIEETNTKMAGFAETVKTVFSEVAQTLQTVFAPSIDAVKGAFDTMREAWNNSKPDYMNGAQEVISAFMTLGEYLVADFYPNMINAYVTNLAPMIGDVGGFLIEEIGKTFSWLGELTNSVTNDVILPALETIKTIYTDVFEAIGKVWEEKGAGLLGQLGTFWEGLRDTITNIYETILLPIWNKIVEVVNDVWNNGLKQLVETIIDAVLDIGENILILYNTFLLPVVNWIIDNIYPKVVNVVNKVIEVVGKLLKDIAGVIQGIITVIKGIIDFIVGVFTGDWEKAWEGIQTIFEGVKKWFESAIQFWKDLFSGLCEILQTWFTNAWEAIKAVWEGVSGFFSGVWEGIKKCFSGVANWFKDIFSKAWQAVKDVFCKGGEVFRGIKEAIAEVFKSTVNHIIDGVNKVIKVPFDAINKMLSTLKGIEILGVKPFGWVKTFKVPQIPKLAKGGVVDSATLALIGERGKEAVVPLENNTEWMDKLVDRLASAINTPSKIVLTVDGKALGWANINSINSITKETGSLQLVMA